MNRPKRPMIIGNLGMRCGKTALTDYINDLEKYCNELETLAKGYKQSLDLFKYSVDNLRKENEKLEKALDMSCSELRHFQYHLYKLMEKISNLGVQNYKSIELKLPDEWKQLFLKEVQDE